MPLARLLQLTSPIPLIVAAIGLLPIMLRSLITGFLQGLQWFTTIGIMEVVSGSLRILAGVVLVLVGLDAVGAVAAFPAASGIAALIGIYTLRHFYSTSERVALHE